MSRDILPPEDGEELKKLYSELTLANQTATLALSKHGMESKIFADADKDVGVIFQKIGKIRGSSKSY